MEQSDRIMMLLTPDRTRVIYATVEGQSVARETIALENASGRSWVQANDGTWLPACDREQYDAGKRAVCRTIMGD